MQTNSDKAGVIQVYGREQGVTINRIIAITNAIKNDICTVRTDSFPDFMRRKVKGRITLILDNSIKQCVIESQYYKPGESLVELIISRRLCDMAEFRLSLNSMEEKALLACYIEILQYQLKHIDEFQEDYDID